MQVILLCILGCSSGLKLLEETLQAQLPTKPFKPAGGKDYTSTCKTDIAAFTFPDYAAPIAAAGTETLGLAAGTPCALELEAASKKWAKTVAGMDSDEAKKYVGIVAVPMARCCQDAESSFYNPGVGKPPLPGVVGCKAATFEAPDTVIEGVSITYNFYADGVTWEAATGLKATGAASEFTVFKITASDLATTGSGPISVSADSTVGTPSAVGTLADLDLARKQCMGGKFDMEAGKWYTLGYPKLGAGMSPTCGGFCTDNQADAFAPTYYATYTCYLEEGTVANGNANKFCYSTKAPSPGTAQMPMAFNDPKIKNIAGEEFEILTSGTFTMLQLAQNSEANLLILATIDRAGSRCGATYIQNVTASGVWVSSLGVPGINVRANAAVPKTRALQVSFDKEESWISAAEWNGKVRNVSFDNSKFSFYLRSVTVEVSVDSHRIVEQNKKTRRFANFLNLGIKGIREVAGSQVVTGLLGSDDHRDVTVMPDDCQAEARKLLSLSSAGFEAKPRSCPLEECGAPVPTKP